MPKQLPPPAKIGKHSLQGGAQAGVKRKREDGGGDEITEGKRPKERKVGDGGATAGIVES